MTLRIASDAEVNPLLDPHGNLLPWHVVDQQIVNVAHLRAPYPLERHQVLQILFEGASRPGWVALLTPPERLLCRIQEQDSRGHTFSDPFEFVSQRYLNIPVSANGLGIVNGRLPSPRDTNATLPGTGGPRQGGMSMYLYALISLYRYIRVPVYPYISVPIYLYVRISLCRRIHIAPYLYALASACSSPQSPYTSCGDSTTGGKDLC